MPRILKLLVIAVAVLMLIFPAPLYSQGLQVEISLTGEANPSLSRFIGFTGVIPQASARKINMSTLKLLVNGENQTYRMVIEEDPQKRDLYLTYKPSEPLPTGKVVQRLEFMTREGNLIVKQWTFTVDPSADPDLAPWATAVKAKPRDVNAHYQLAIAFEKKYLLEDAAAEYLKVLEYDPGNRKSKAAYERIFSSWDRKSITLEKVTLDVSKNSGLEKIGSLITFRLVLFNSSRNTVKFDPDEVYLMIDGEQQESAITDLAGYPRWALDKDFISMEDYARLGYFLETHPLRIFKKVELEYGTSKTGHLAFTTRGVYYKKLTLVVPIVVGSKRTIMMKFPFVKQ
ncbi:MAG: hypothetical protein M1536_04070 [Firmicutes bacterium]|nr:hypothetical protein [Bacillota bacterium]